MQTLRDMKVVRDLHTGLFWAGVGVWTRSPRLAHDFPDYRGAQQILDVLEVESADFLTMSEDGQVVTGLPLRIRDD